MPGLFNMSPARCIYPWCSHLVAGVEDVLEVLAHAVVLYGEEDGVEDDAERHHEVEEGVVDHREEDVLGAQPALVVQAADLAARTVTVVARLCKCNAVKAFKI